MWEGVAGICWLLTAPAEALTDDGGFYLDCAAREKHLAGGVAGFTQNVPSDVDALLQQLEAVVAAAA